MEGTSGPKILLEFLMAVGVTGKFTIVLEFTLLVKYCYDGYPTSPRARRADLAPSYSRRVNHLRFYATVLTSTVTRSMVSW